MTIAQQFLGKKGCKHQEEPLVPSEKTASIKDAEEGRPVVVTMHAHVRRVSSLTTLCVFATALLVLTTGIIGGMYLYRQFAHYKARPPITASQFRSPPGGAKGLRGASLDKDESPRKRRDTIKLRHFRGWCSIPYLPDVQDDLKHEALVSGQKHHAAASIATEAWETDSPKANFFEEEFDIDIKYEQYERIEVPSFANGRRGQFVHDFVVNKTAIVDYENRRCFIMILNRNYVYPPRILYEQVSKMRAGYYDVDTQTVRHIMQVVTPPISDLKNVGFYIARDCASMPIYMLEKANSPVYKRSLNKESKQSFVEFAGNKVNLIKIININDATPGEKPSESS